MFFACYVGRMPETDKYVFRLIVTRARIYASEKNSYIVRSLLFDLLSVNVTESSSTKALRFSASWGNWKFNIA